MSGTLSTTHQPPGAMLRAAVCSLHALFQCRTSPLSGFPGGSQGVDGLQDAAPAGTGCLIVQLRRSVLRAVIAVRKTGLAVLQPAPADVDGLQPRVVEADVVAFTHVEDAADVLSVERLIRRRHGGGEPSLRRLQKVPLLIDAVLRFPQGIADKHRLVLRRGGGDVHVEGPQMAGLFRL